MKIKLERKEVVTFLLVIFVSVCYLFCLEVIGIEGKGDNLRYVAFLIAIICGYVTLFFRGKLINKRKDNVGREINYIYIVVIIFYILSVFQAQSVGHELGRRTYIQLALLLIPAMYSYCIVNILRIRTIMKLFEILLFINIFFYVFIHVGLFKFFDWNNWLAISYFNSRSSFETSVNPDQFLAFFTYFNYFKESGENQKEKYEYKFFWVLSFIFVLLTFKRLNIVFAISMLFLNQIIDLKGKVFRWMPVITAVFFSIVTFLYTLFMKGELFTEIDVYKFSTGRDYILSLWASKNYLSYGFGSSYEVINRYLEMDLVQIYLEIGIIAVFVITYFYFKIAKVNIYTYILMFMQFLNLLMASSFPFPMGWVLNLVTIVCISSTKMEDENIQVARKKGMLYRLLINKKNHRLQ